MDIYKERFVPLFEGSKKPDRTLEDEIGLPRTSLYNWKCGRSKNYRAYLPQIAAYFNVSVDYLLGKSDEKRPAPQEGSEARVTAWLHSLPPEKLQAILTLGDAPEDVAVLFQTGTSR